MPAALAERYRAEGAWDDRTLGRVPARLPARRPDPPLPDLVAHAPLPRDRRRGLRGGAAGGRRAAGARPRSRRRRGLPAAQLGRGGHHLLRLRHARRDARADRALLRPQGGRLHPAPERGPGPDHRVAHRPARLPGRPGDGPRRPRRAWSRSSWWATSTTSVRTVVRFDELRRRRARSTGPAPVDPDSAARSSATPRGRRPIPRAWCTPTAPSAARCASCRATRPSGTGPTSSARRSGTPSGCWAGCSARSSAAGPST